MKLGIKQDKQEPGLEESECLLHIKQQSPIAYPGKPLL